jgi:vitamin B12 transporter
MSMTPAAAFFRFVFVASLFTSAIVGWCRAVAADETDSGGTSPSATFAPGMGSAGSTGGPSSAPDVSSGHIASQPHTDASSPAAPPSSEAPIAEIVPPELVHEVTPRFPAAAREVGIVHAAVVLRITVTTDGQVTDIELVEPAGHGFDEAAQEAVSGYRFIPARKGELALAARIAVRIEFRLPEQETAPKTSPTNTLPPAPQAPPKRTPVASKPDSPVAQAPEVEVTIKGYNDAERLRRSAEAVHVLETKAAKQRTADLGEVLARTQGVGVQRSGGLGSETRVSLNGLTDDQIRFFVDGVPLDFMGLPFGLANVPVNLVDRVEIYRGVVPLRFGADALGGGVNLVTDQDIAEGSHASTSIQAGSFGTYRLTLGGHYRDEAEGWFARLSGFFDRADNDYPMDDVDVPDATGQPKSMRVYRFHDGYRAQGGSFEVGMRDQPAARKLVLRGFVTQYAKEIQHNLLMSFNPYGDVELREVSKGATLRYENVLARQVLVKLLAGYAHRATEYEDLGECVYNWFAQCIRSKPQPGERTGRAQDQDYWEHNFFARVNGEWRLVPGQSLRLSLAPTSTTRGGKEHRLANPDARDPLAAERALYGLVSGLEHELDAFDDQLENVLFIKDYLQVLRSEDPLSSGEGFRRRDRTTHRFGVGDSLRYAFVEWLYAKASYEWATRLPRADEIFGNAFPIQPNLELSPETSHNFNLGITLDGFETVVGSLHADVNGFLRDAKDLIVLVGDNQTARYQNVFHARSLGAELAAGWSSPFDYVAIDGNVTYVDFRNTSSYGGFQDYKGDRIPNRPYLFATGNLRLSKRDVASPSDELSANWTSRYVHSFLRAWEGLGSDKLEVPAQLVHAVACTYFIQGNGVDLSFTGEVQNVTDEKVFDIFRVPRPGRATYFKATLSL